MKVYVEPPPGWGPKRVLLVQLERLGYRVTEWLVDGEPVFELS